MGANPSRASNRNGGADMTIDLGVCPIVVHDEQTAREAGQWVERAAIEALESTDADTPKD